MNYDTTAGFSSKVIDLGETKRAAQGRWREILVARGIPESCLQNKHGPCPVHGGTKPYRFDDLGGNGTFICTHCGAGDGFSLLKLFHGWEFKQTLKEVASYLAGSQVPYPSKAPLAESSSKPNTPNLRVIKENEELWNSSYLITPGTPAYKYFERRLHGWITYLACRSEALRWHPKVEYFHDGKKIDEFAAIIARASNLAGEAVAYRKIYITDDGEKAKVPAPKKWTPVPFKGATKGSAVRLYPIEPDTPLIVGEGLENVLAAIHLFGTPGWAGGDAATMSSMELPPPGLVPEVLIIVDNDRHKTGAGETYSAKLEQRLIAESRNVRKFMCREAGVDFDDLSI